MAVTLIFCGVGFLICLTLISVSWQRATEWPVVNPIASELAQITVVMSSVGATVFFLVAWAAAAINQGSRPRPAPHTEAHQPQATETTEAQQ